MRFNLAKQFLVQLMNWDDLEATKNLREMDLMSDIKYDSYDQFMPGIKFVGNFYLWLSQFKDLKDRKLMYEFVKKYIIYINSTQISHLIDLLYNTKIVPLIREKVVGDYIQKGEQVNKYNYRLLENSTEFKSHKRKTLFIGLSDGSHIDIIRRNSYLDNDQVLTNYYPDDNKVKDLGDKLVECVDLANDANKKFESIVLIDDFTASGSSFIRKKEDGTYGGKLPTFFKALNSNDKFKNLLTDNYEIHLYFLIATENALSYIKELLEHFMQQYNNVKVEVDCIQKLYDDAKFTSHHEEDAKAMLEIISQKRYVNEPQLTDAYKKSYAEGDDSYHLGYKQCALTVVLNHNTPNNSLPIIWQPKREDKENPLYPLFYRITRH